MLNTGIINIEKTLAIAAIAEYVGSTPSRVLSVLQHPQVSWSTKMFLLSLAPDTQAVQ